MDLPENSDIISEIVKKSDGYTFSEIEKLAVSINVECAIKGENHFFWNLEQLKSKFYSKVIFILSFKKIINGKMKLANIY